MVNRHFPNDVVEEEGRGRVVDILRGKPEMNEFPHAAQPQRVETLLEKILHRLDIVVGRALDGFDVFGVRFAEIFKNFVERVYFIILKYRELRQAVLADRDEVLYFNKYAVANQCVFAEIIGEFPGFVGIPAVNGRNGCKHEEKAAVRP